MKTFYRIFSYLLLIIGLIHALMTPIFYQGLSENAMWFIGTGLALIFLGIFNIAILKASEKVQLTLCITANIIGTFYLFALTFILKDPQAWLAVVISIGTLVGSVKTRLNGLE